MGFELGISFLPPFFMGFEPKRGKCHATRMVPRRGDGGRRSCVGTAHKGTPKVCSAQEARPPSPPQELRHFPREEQGKE